MGSNYRLIRVDGKLYRYVPNIPLPPNAELVLETIEGKYEYYALLRYPVEKGLDNTSTTSLKGVSWQKP